MESPNKENPDQNLQPEKNEPLDESTKAELDQKQQESQENLSAHKKVELSEAAIAENKAKADLIVTGVLGTEVVSKFDEKGEAVNEKVLVEKIEDVENMPVKTLRQLESKHPGLLGMLFLRKNGKRPDFFKNIEQWNEKDFQQSYQSGDRFEVNFQGNEDAEFKIGAGEMLPPQIRMVVIEKPEGKFVGMRRTDPRPGYYSADGEYIPVFSGDVIYIPTQEEANNFYKNKEVQAWEQEDYDEQKGVSVFNFDNELLKRRKSAEDGVNDGLTKDEIRGESRLRKKMNLGDIKVESKNFDDYTGKLFKDSPLADIPGIEDQHAITIGEDSDPHALSYEKIFDPAFYNQIPGLGRILSQFTNEEEKMNLYCLVSAIGDHETEPLKYKYPYRTLGGYELKTGIHKGTVAVGKYQMMPVNIVAGNPANWVTEVMGEHVQFTPAVQDIVAFGKLGEYYLKAKSIGFTRIEDIIDYCSGGRWYGNNRQQIYSRRGGLQITLSGANAPGGLRGPAEYALDVKRRFRRFRKRFGDSALVG